MQPTLAALPITVTSPLGADKLWVVEIEGEEELSGLFHYRVKFISEDNALDFKAIVGKAITLTITLAGGDPYYVHAIVGRFAAGQSNGRHFTYSADLRPWFWMLKFTRNCRMFQSKSVPDIISEVFNGQGQMDFTNSLTATYTPREYCVQFMESDFDFVSRLMEEEGITYFFEHSDSAHKLVFCDDSSAFQDCTGLTTVSLLATQKEPPPEDTIQECTVEQSVVVGQYEADDYNFETTAVDLYVKSSSESADLSVYEYPGKYQKKDEGETISKRRLEAFEAEGTLLTGKSTCRSFRPGCKFTLAAHFRDEANTSYVVRSVRHRGGQLTYYQNTFVAFPTATPFRPPRITPKPRIYGTQTAVVAGKEGEEIWTDKYGRIKVQFHWDQVGQNDENSSCWIRVAQGWAGKKWGAFFLPRIGMEVVVTFLDGDPDQPLVTGVVYNATMTTPYALPADGTKSTLKSNSSKGGGGFNEIRFEDKKGSEELFVHAQKDMNTTVLNDDATTVMRFQKNNILKGQRNTVGAERFTAVGDNDELHVQHGDRIIEVETGDERHEVKGKRDLTIEGNETHTNKGNYESKVSGNYTLKVTGNITIEASGSVTIKSGTDLTAKAGTSLTNQAGTSLTNKAGTTMENNAGISLTNKASASQTVDGGGMLTLKGGLVKIN